MLCAALLLGSLAHLVFSFVVTGKVVVIMACYGYVQKKNELFVYWLRVIMGNFVQTTAVDYGPLRVITDYGGLCVISFF